MSEQDDTPPPPKESTESGAETGSEQEDEAPSLDEPSEEDGAVESEQDSGLETEVGEENSDDEDTAPEPTLEEEDEPAEETQDAQTAQTALETQDAQETQESQTAQETQDTQDAQTEGGEQPLSPDLERHIFEGETNRGGDLVGYHHREGGEDHGDAKLVSQGDPDENGVYTGRWTQEGRADDKFSTFFPDSYSKDDVRGAVREGFDNRSATGKPGQWQGVTSDGSTIQGYVKSGTSIDDATEDDITTAHPVRKK